MIPQSRSQHRSSIVLGGGLRDALDPKLKR
jgi:hypothetical protein